MRAGASLRRPYWFRSQRMGREFPALQDGEAPTHHLFVELRPAAGHGFIDLRGDGNFILDEEKTHGAAHGKRKRNE